MNEEEVAVVVAGSIHLVSHAASITEPTVIAILNPGDIIGFASIDNGLSRDLNCWVCAWEQCDVFILSTDYLRYMWDSMKQNKNLIAVVELVKRHFQ